MEPEIVDAAMNGQLISEEEVEVRPEKVSVSCLDENVCLASCQKYFTADAWLAVLQVVELIKKNPTYYCGRCTQAILDQMQCLIVCDCCLTWFHFACVCLKQSPKRTLWFCRSCSSSAKSYI